MKARRQDVLPPGAFAACAAPARRYVMGLMSVRRRLHLAPLAVACALALAPAAARAAPAEPEASAEDEARLADGATVSYPQTIYRHGRRYVGGVSYTVINASVPELTGLLADSSAYTQVLPHARDTRLVARTGSDRLVEITQGNSLVQAAYTLLMRTDDGDRRVRFWLDRSRPHDIADAWGYFRVEPLADAPDGSPRVLLSYGILVDLGPGLMRDLFESRIQASMLTVPERLRAYAVRRFRGRPRA